MRCAVEMHEMMCDMCYCNVTLERAEQSITSIRFIHSRGLHLSTFCYSSWQCDIVAPVLLLIDVRVRHQIRIKSLKLLEQGTHTDLYRHIYRSCNKHHVVAVAITCAVFPDPTHRSSPGGLLRHEICYSKCENVKLVDECVSVTHNVWELACLV